MVRIVTQAVVGIVLCLGAIGALYYYFSMSDSGLPSWFLIASAVSFLGGVALLFLSGRSDSLFYPHADPSLKTDLVTPEMSSLIEKNQLLSSEYQSAAEKQEKLRLAGLTATENNPSSPT